MTTTLLVPAFNEGKCIKEIMSRVEGEWVDQILVVDGGSTDGTVECAQELGLHVFVQKEKGLRKAYMEAMEYITGDIIITFSPDGNCIPELIPLLVNKMKEGYDMVIVSRYAKGAKSYDDDRVTSFGNWMFTTLINLFHGGRYTDAMGIYRAYKKELIYTLDLDKNRSYEREEKMFRTHVSWEPLLSIRCAKRKLKVTDIPGDEPPRIGGERKLQIFRWGAAYLFEIIREIFLWH